MNKLAFALAGALALTGCKTEEKNPAHEGMSTGEIAAQLKADNDAEIQIRIDQYLIDVKDIPVERNGKSFTIDAQAFCNSVPQDSLESYTAPCTQNAIADIQTQFACARYSIPPALVRTTNEDILKAGFQNLPYDSKYLYSNEKLKKRISLNDQSMFKEDVFILTDSSDIPAIKETYIFEGDKPESCPS